MHLLTYLLTYLLTPWCRVLEKLTGLQLVKKFPTFHGTRRFITALTTVRHLSLSWASPIQSIYPHPTSWRSTLILSTHLHLGLPSGLFPSGLNNFRIININYFSVIFMFFSQVQIISISAYSSHWILKQQRSVFTVRCNPNVWMWFRLTAFLKVLNIWMWFRLTALLKVLNIRSNFVGVKTTSGDCDKTQFQSSTLSLSVASKLVKPSLRKCFSSLFACKFIFGCLSFIPA